MSEKRGGIKMVHVNNTSFNNDFLYEEEDLSTHKCIMCK